LNCAGAHHTLLLNFMIVIGSRGSKLALWQANWVKSRLERRHPGLEVSIKIIKTTGDRIRDVALTKIGGRGVFTKEIEEAMLRGQINIAVHSLKDLPTTLPEGLHIAAISKREDVRDALVARDGIGSLADLPAGAVVGTSSLRRQSQLRALRPDLQFRDLRGNVDTRLRKVAEGEYDAIILASAGLIRLGYAGRIIERLPVEKMLPAIGQGALAIETRVDDEETNRLVAFLNHKQTRAATLAERALLRSLGGGCQAPIAAVGLIEDGKLVLHALVASPDGTEIVRRRISGAPEEAEKLGARLASRLLKAGADRILERVRSPLEQFES